jgi:hypothetical protein
MRLGGAERSKRNRGVSTRRRGSPNSKTTGRRVRQKHHPLERRSKAATLKSVSFLRRSLLERRHSCALENREADRREEPAKVSRTSQSSSTTNTTGWPAALLSRRDRDVIGPHRRHDGGQLHGRTTSRCSNGAGPLSAAVTFLPKSRSSVPGE